MKGDRRPVERTGEGVQERGRANERERRDNQRVGEGQR